MATIHTPVSGVPTLIYTPAASGTPHVTIVNEGTSIVYIGQAGVTSANGMPLQPSQEVSLPFAPVSLYAASGVASAGTTINTNAVFNSGATSLTFAGNFYSAAVNGGQAQIGSGSNAEVVTISAGGGTGTLTVSALKYDHRTASPVGPVTPAGSAVHTEAAC
jgi:hypothetical protein